MLPLGVEQMMHIARQHCQAGRLADSEGLCRQVLKEQPTNADAWALLGLLAFRNKQIDRAIHFLQRAIEIEPTAAEAHCNLGVALNAKGLFDQAIASHQRAVELQPTRAELYANLGAALASAQRWDHAIAAYEAAGRLKPDFADAHYNLGNALRAIERFDQAVAAYQQAVRINPSFAEAISNLGIVLRSLGRLDEARGAYDRAIELNPESPEPHWNRAVTLLLAGDYERGWAAYEWRLRQPWAKPRRFAVPRWEGEELAGRTILLHAEQGLGDTIQFARYIPLVAERGGRVIIECQPELRDLLTSLPGTHHVIPQGAALPKFDVHCPLMSLPGIFATRLDSIPATKLYLTADPRLVEAWRDRLKTDAGRIKVGLAWAGRPEHQSDRQRSMSLADLTPLAAVAPVDFYSLQKGAIADPHRPPEWFGLIDCALNLITFADTAALVHHMDLVICVDTAVAHLAGAMGKPVWLLLPVVPDWRWLLERSDTPWYPTMRLFRQEQPGKWAGPVGHVVTCLTELAQSTSARPGLAGS
jgi:tetratricopeptide (TPR) repeat protein